MEHLGAASGREVSNPARLGNVRADITDGTMLSFADHGSMIDETGRANFNRASQGTGGAAMTLPLNVALEDLGHALDTRMREVAAEVADDAILRHIAAEKPEKLALSCPEAARALGIADAKVRQLVKDGTIPSFVIDESHPKILRSDLEAYCRRLIAEQIGRRSIDNGTSGGSGVT